MNTKFYTLLFLVCLISTSCAGPKVVVEYQGSSPYPRVDSTTSESQSPKTSLDSSDENYVIISAFPEIRGGNRALRKKILYPKEAIENRIEGTVSVQFFVEENGETSGFKIIEGIGHGCEEAVISAIEEIKFDMNGQNDARFLWLATVNFEL
jgi:TonB family protein